MIELGFPADKCIAIPNGVDWSRFESLDLPRWSSREPHVLMAARFAQQKDPMTLIKAMGLLKERNVNTRLSFAGLGKPQLIRQCQEASNRAGLSDRIDFLGHVPRIPQLLSQHQIFVLSTHYEGMPLALIEAMACGCACIGSDVVGVREVIEHGQTGLLVPEGDSQALADALMRLLEQPDWAQNMGKAARKQVKENFNLSLMHSRYTSLMNSLTK